MGREGVEPSRYHYRRILSPLRLPIPPSPQQRLFYLIYGHRQGNGAGSVILFGAAQFFGEFGDNRKAVYPGGGNFPDHNPLLDHTA